MEDDYAAPTTSEFSRPKIPATGVEEIMELLWQNGQVVVQSQNQRPPKKITFGCGETALDKEIRRSGEDQQDLFMQEDEMVSWLQYPLDDSSFDRDLYADLLYTAPPPPPPPPVSTVTQPRTVAEIRPPPAPPQPPIPPVVTKPDNINSPRLPNFMHFSRLPSRPSTEPMKTNHR